MTRILCLAEDPADAANLEAHFDRLGYEARFFADVDSVWRPLNLGIGDVAVVVCQRPHHLGLDLLSRIDPDNFPTPIIILSGESTVEHAVHAMRSGAADYLPMPVRVEALALALEHARTRAALRHDRREVRRRAAVAEGVSRKLVGVSRQMQELRRMIGLVAATEVSVLIEGESGTGKELVARSVHERSRRADAPFVAINCAAMPDGLVESTLFGHEKGAFTGATQRQLGAFERADNGTLFLDEISEMRLDLQAKLLRVIQESDFERVGGRETIRVNVRLISSTNRNLQDEVEAGRFRADLYYRLQVVPVKTTPLRERRDDIPELIDHAVEMASNAFGIPAPKVPAETLDDLMAYDWPGNVRELINATQRALILADGARLTAEHFMLDSIPAANRRAQLPATTGGSAEVEALPTNLAELESLAIQRALDLSGGVRSKAARLLGISERTLRNRLNLPLTA